MSLVIHSTGALSSVKTTHSCADPGMTARCRIARSSTGLHRLFVNDHVF